MSLEKADKDALAAALKAKASLEEELERIEKQIYDLEGNYLGATAQYGNVLRGWAGVGSLDKLPPADDASHAVAPTERLFSLSSVTSPVFRTPAVPGAPAVLPGPPRGADVEGAGAGAGAGAAAGAGSGADARSR